MDHRAVARMIAVGRIAVGTILLIAPGLMGRGWGGEAGSQPGGKLFLRALGGRDLALGLGALRALDGEAGEAVDWVRAGALADATDAVATTVAAGRISSPGKWWTAAIATVFAVVGWRAAGELD